MKVICSTNTVCQLYTTIFLRSVLSEMIIVISIANSLSAWSLTKQSLILCFLLLSMPTIVFSQFVTIFASLNSFVQASDLMRIRFKMVLTFIRRKLNTTTDIIFHDIFICFHFSFFKHHIICINKFQCPVDESLLMPRPWKCRVVLQKSGASPHHMFLVSFAKGSKCCIAIRAPDEFFVPSRRVFSQGFLSFLGFLGFLFSSFLLSASPHMSDFQCINRSCGCSMPVLQHIHETSPQILMIPPYLCHLLVIPCLRKGERRRFDACLFAWGPECTSGSPSGSGVL